MSSLPESPAAVNEQGPDLAFYRQRAQATKARRQAAGRYTRPTKAQSDAAKKTMQRDGNKNLTIEEMGLLATHPYYTASQRAEYAAMAQAAIESAVR